MNLIRAGNMKGFLRMKNLAPSVFLLFILSNPLLLAQTDQDAGQDPFSQAKFVPDISLILDLSYLERDISDHLARGGEVPGFLEEESAAHSHPGMNSERGFNFNYAELSIFSAVDPYFDLTAIFHIAPESFGLEEGYFSTRDLPLGFRVKGGKFLSGIGKLSEQHPHYWDFAGAPLIYQAFFGPEGLNEIGIQFNWLAPTDNYLLLGTEILQGENEESFGREGVDDPAGNSITENIDRPNLITGFIKSSFDAGDVTFLLGVSGAFGGYRAGWKHGTDDADRSTESGETKIFNTNLTLKYLIDSYRNVTLQAEYLQRFVNGNLFLADSAMNIRRGTFEKNQSGLYSQLVYKLSKYWKIGTRLDLLINNSVIEDGWSSALPDMLPRLGLMAEYSPTEFSRLRLQYSRDETNYVDGDKTPVNEILFQVNFIIGAHGAHQF